MGLIPVDPDWPKGAGLSILVAMSRSLRPAGAVLGLLATALVAIHAVPARAAGHHHPAHSVLPWWGQVRPTPPAREPPPPSGAPREAVEVVPLGEPGGSAAIPVAAPPPFTPPAAVPASLSAPAAEAPAPPPGPPGHGALLLALLAGGAAAGVGVALWRRRRREQ